MAYVDTTDLTTWGIVNVVLTGLFIKPLFIIWMVSLCLARRKGDHARVGFTWMKLVFPSYILALLLYVVAGGLYIYIVPWLLDDSSAYYADYDEDTMLTVYNIEVRVSSVGQFFDDVATALLLISIVEIANGFLYAKAGAVRTGLQKGVRWATISFSGVVVVLSIAHLGLTNSAWGKYFDYRSGRRSDGMYFAIGDFDRDLRTIRQITAAVVVLFWVATLAMISFAGYVVHRVKDLEFKRSSAVILLVATILLFVRYTWQLVYVATWILPENSSGTPLAINAVDPILTAWIMFVILVLLFVIGIRKQKGLWTTEQRWMNMPPPHVTPGQGGGWSQGAGVYPPQPVYQQYPPQQYAYAVPQQQPEQQQGWVQQQGLHHPSQEVHGHVSPQGSSPPYVPSPAQELPNGEQREK
ncbi:hypothetical protein GE09DRAFT_732016 [Coniochaeta sp. 2T2.1]|nr:hypothetical protein GE09DRAFT_732016 [Coniochaeta sp. 2T2.1]